MLALRTKVCRSSIKNNAVRMASSYTILYLSLPFTAESERYRNTLRRRDQEIKDYQEAAALQALENQKYTKEHSNYEERIAFLEGELSIAQQAHAQLDEQKQENLMLKETIDRMRFDMDEMRNNAASTAVGGSSGQSSRASTVSKSLGDELLGKMTGGQWGKLKGNQWGIVDHDNEGEGEEEGESVETVVELDSEGEETEGEDVVQTIITRKKRVCLLPTSLLPCADCPDFGSSIHRRYLVVQIRWKRWNLKKPKNTRTRTLNMCPLSSLHRPRLKPILNPNSSPHRSVLRPTNHRRKLSQYKPSQTRNCHTRSQ